MNLTPNPPIIYLASKYTEAHPYLIQRNIDRARYYAQEVALLGGMPLAPPMIGAHFEGVQDYDWWSKAYMNVLRRSDAVFMVPGWVQSKGANRELQMALELEMPVFYTLETLKEWIENGC